MRTHCRSHIPVGRCTDCHRQFLPKHRESENQYLLVADTPITVSVAGTTDIPALLWAGRHLDMYAGIGLLCFCNGSGGIVDICKKITHRNYRKSEVKVIYSTANIAFYVITNKLFENISFIQPKHIIYAPQTDGLSTPNA